MLNIPCPFCGNRNESEFIHGGPAKAARPENLADISDADWVHYLTVPGMWWGRSMNSGGMSEVVASGSP